MKETKISDVHILMNEIRTHLLHMLLHKSEYHTAFHYDGAIEDMSNFLDNLEKRLED